jgi:hypothetical protein
MRWFRIVQIVNPTRYVNIETRLCFGNFLESVVRHVDGFTFPSLEDAINLDITDYSAMWNFHRKHIQKRVALSADYPCWRSAHIYDCELIGRLRLNHQSVSNFFGYIADKVSNSNPRPMRGYELLFASLYERICGVYRSFQLSPLKEQRKELKYRSNDKCDCEPKDSFLGKSLLLKGKSLLLKVTIYILLFFGGLCIALAGVSQLYDKRRILGSALVRSGVLFGVFASGLLLLWSWWGGS